MDGNLEQITSEVTSAAHRMQSSHENAHKSDDVRLLQVGQHEDKKLQRQHHHQQQTRKQQRREDQEENSGPSPLYQEQQQQHPMDAILSSEGAIWWRNQGSGVGSLVSEPAMTDQDKPRPCQQHLKEHAAEDEKADGIMHENSELSMEAKNHVVEEEEKEENDEDEVLLLQSARTRAEVDHPPKSSSTAPTAVPSPARGRRLWLPDAPVSRTPGPATSAAASSVFDFTEADATPLRRSRLTSKRRKLNGHASDRDTGSEEVDDFSTMTTMEHVKRVLYGDSL